MVKNSPCNAGDAGLISGWETKITHATEQINPHTTRESMHLNERSYMMQQKDPTEDFPGASVVGNPPANAVYTGLIPDAGGSHMPQSN